MSAAVASAVERWMLYGQIGICVIDELTGQSPVGWLRYSLDVKSEGSWRPTGWRPVFTASGVAAYPEIGRIADPAGVDPLECLVRLEAEFYRPLYRALGPGVEFTVYPYSHTSPPQKLPSSATVVIVVPAANYPFTSHVPVLRGLVVQAGTRAPVADAVVSRAGQERVLTDGRGAFALPLRWTKQNELVPIDAVDERTKANGSQSVSLPADLGRTITIAIH